MDIQVARLREVLGLLKPVIPRKTTLPALTCVLFKDGKAVATDLETMVITKVPEADTACLLPAAEVVKTIQYVHGLEYLHIEATDGKIKMSWSNGSSTFGTEDVGGFPDVPEFVPVDEATLDIDTLIPAMYEVLSFAATEETRPVLRGVTLVLGESVAVAAGDGFRMAYKSLPLSFPHEGIVIVPHSSVTALKLLREKTPRTPPTADTLIPIIMAKQQASVSLDGKTGLRFVFGDSTTAIVKLIDGNPPAWLKLMPKKKPVFQASLMGADLELAVRRVLAVAWQGKKVVRLVFNEETATISAVHEDQEGESTIKVLISQGAPNRVGLDASFLLDYLKGKEGIVSLSWEKDGSPVVFNHQKSPTVLIMPMAVAWDGEPAEEEEPEPEPEGEEESGKDEEPSEEPEPVEEGG